MDKIQKSLKFQTVSIIFEVNLVLEIFNFFQVFFNKTFNFSRLRPETLTQVLPLLRINNISIIDSFVWI